MTHHKKRPPFKVVFLCVSSDCSHPKGFAPFRFAFWFSAFFIRYKKLTLENSEVEIYAGLSTHYIKVNEKLKDEYKASFSFSPIKLSCDINSHRLEVTISTSNHITIKLDNKLV